MSTLRKIKYIVIKYHYRLSILSLEEMEDLARVVDCESEQLASTPLDTESERIDPAKTGDHEHVNASE